MQKLPASGRVRNIGISNFGIKHFERLEAHPEFKTVPAVNQIEVNQSLIEARANCLASPKLSFVSLA
jgi:diketogulonate reductase-like aldo/keto reductase